jgi:multiple sugar transport system ATP-binding protein
MSVAKNITFGMKVRGVDSATQERKLAEVARQLQIEPLLNRRPGQLSGGQRQRVAMGRALVRDPKLFLFDEPLSNLDAKLRVEMRTEIKALHQNLGASMVYVTHDQIEAMTLATKIVVMKGGVIQQIGSPSEIYNRPANLFVADFMGSPAMNLIPARAQGNGSGTRIEIAREGGEPIVLTDARARDLPEDVIVGLRPEDIAEPGFRHGEAVQEASCKIDIVEPAGADTYVMTHLGGKPVTARLHSETEAAPGATHTFAFDLSKVSYFEPESGRRLN